MDNKIIPRTYIWKLDNTTQVPELIYESNNEDEFICKINEYLNDKNKSFGFRIERWKKK